MKKIYWLHLIVLFFHLSCTKDKEGVIPKFVPTITIVGNTTITEGSKLTFFLTLDSASTETTSIEYLTENITAIAGEDYDGVLVSKTLQFQPGEKSLGIAIQTLTDNVSEGDETFLIKFSNVKNGTLANQEVTITIKNKAQSSTSTTPTYFMETNIGASLWKAQIGGFFGASMNTSMAYSVAGYGSGAFSDSQISFIATEMFEVKSYKVGDRSGSDAIELYYSPTFFSSGMMGETYIGYEGEFDVDLVDLEKKVASGTFTCKMKNEDGKIIEFINGKFKLPIE